MTTFLWRRSQKELMDENRRDDKKRMPTMSAELLIWRLALKANDINIRSYAHNIEIIYLLNIMR